jgi:parallel beta-helix repeat protein
VGSALALAYNVQPVKSDYAWTETIYIRADGSIVPSTASISSVDNVTYTLTDNIVGNIPGNSSAIVIQRDNIAIDGAGHTLQSTNVQAFFSTGIELTGRSNDTIKNMKTMGFWWGIFFNSSNNSVSGNNIVTNNNNGLYLVSSSYNSVSGNNIANNDNGILLDSFSNDNNIGGNNITANMYSGIDLSSSSTNSISGNNITNNTGGGIHGYSASNNSISGNNITANNGDGIDLETYSSSNSVIGNDIRANNDMGIVLEIHSSNNSVSGNNIIANNFYGIWLAESSDNNSVTGNNIAANAYGGITLDFSSDNTIYHNNFMNNNGQAYSHNSTTVWDDGYPSGGNYWSDYNGTDSTSDGIGDTAYVIDASNTDHYPLMGMFYDFNVSYIAPGYDVELISNSSVSAFGVGFWIEHPNIRIIKFNVTGETGTAGFCRICIPTALLNDSYTVLLNGTEIPSTLLPFSNSTHSYLYFNYTHSTEEITITPEFPSFLILPMFMVATLVAVIIYKRKRTSSALDVEDGALIVKKKA